MQSYLQFILYFFIMLFFQLLFCNFTLKFQVDCCYFIISILMFHILLMCLVSILHVCVHAHACVYVYLCVCEIYIINSFELLNIKVKHLAVMKVNWIGHSFFVIIFGWQILMPNKTECKWFDCLLSVYIYLG